VGDLNGNGNGNGHGNGHGNGNGNGNGKKKLSIYVPEFLLREMEAEATRLERPLSWLLQRAWKIGYPLMLQERAERERKKPG
jgi:uncharacterized small protein (TIGR04563 family)